MRSLKEEVLSETGIGVDKAPSYLRASLYIESGVSLGLAKVHSTPAHRVYRTSSKHALEKPSVCLLIPALPGGSHVHATIESPR